MLNDKELSNLLDNRNIPKGASAYLNRILSDVHTLNNFKENLVTYKSILQDGKYKVQDFFNAVAYVNFKSMNHKNIEAYALVFPVRMTTFKQQGKSIEEIHSIVSGYHRTKLVTNIMAQAQIPRHLLFGDIYQEAIYMNLKIMRDDRTRIDVKQKAAQFLAEHLAMPEDANIQLNITHDGTDFVKEMRNTMEALGSKQLDQLKQGNMSLKDIAASKIVATVEE